MALSLRFPGGIHAIPAHGNVNGVEEPLSWPAGTSHTESTRAERVGQTHDAWLRMDNVKWRVWLVKTQRARSAVLDRGPHLGCGIAGTTEKKVDCPCQAPRRCRRFSLCRGPHRAAWRSWSGDLGRGHKGTSGVRGIKLHTERSMSQTHGHGPTARLVHRKGCWAGWSRARYSGISSDAEGPSRRCALVVLFGSPDLHPTLQLLGRVAGVLHSPRPRRLASWRHPAQLTMAGSCAACTHGARWSC